MKYFLFVLMGLAVVTMVFNTTFLDFDNLFIGQSKIAIIAILASLCVLIIAWILLIAKVIEKREKGQL